MEPNYYKGIPKYKSPKGTRFARVRNYVSVIFVATALVCGVGFHYSSAADYLRERFQRKKYFEVNEDQLLRSMKIWSPLVERVILDEDGFPVEKPKPQMDFMDSSFDLFLPNKISKKALVSAKSKDNNTRKEKSLERAISLSLQETNGSNSSGQQLRGKSGLKIGSAPLLLRRSKADRERIISEKVALVLADPGGRVQSDGFSQCSSAAKLKSRSLKDCLDQEASLWKLSQFATSVPFIPETFTLAIVSKYGEIGSQIIRNDSSEAETNSEETNNSSSLTSNQAIECDADTAPSKVSNVEDDGQRANMDEVPCGDRVSSPQNRADSDASTVPDDRSVQPDVGIDGGQNYDAQDMDFHIFDTLGSQLSGLDRRKRKLDEFYDDNSESSTSTPIVHGVENVDDQLKEAASDNGTSELRMSDSESTCFVNKCPNDVWSADDDAAVLEKLSDELKRLIHVTDSHVVHIYLKDDHKFKALSCILEVRCPLLLNEAQSRIVLWYDIELSVCQAFFTYLYSGCLDGINSLCSAGLQQLNRLCSKYSVNLLAKFVKSISGTEDTRSSDNSELEVINRSVTELSPRPVSPDLFDDSVGPEISSTIEAKVTTDVVCISSQSNSPERSPISAGASTSTGGFPTERPCLSFVENCQTPHGQRIVSSKATPMPDYQSLLTPELKRELDKYGLKKGLDRKKATTLLNYIYEQIHPYKRDPVVQKAIIETQKTLQRSETDSDSVSSSLESDYDYEEEPEEVTSMTTDDKDRVLREIGGFIKENEALHLSILQYKPVKLEELSGSLKEKSLNCSKPVLKFALDELGIDYTAEENEENPNGLRRRKKRKR